MATVIRSKADQTSQFDQNNDKGIIKANRKVMGVYGNLGIKTQKQENFSTVNKRAIKPIVIEKNNKVINEVGFDKSTREPEENDKSRDIEEIEDELQKSLEKERNDALLSLKDKEQLGLSPSESMKRVIIPGLSTYEQKKSLNSVISPKGEDKIDLMKGLEDINNIEQTNIVRILPKSTKTSRKSEDDDITPVNSYQSYMKNNNMQANESFKFEEYGLNNAIFSRMDSMASQDPRNVSQVIEISNYESLLSEAASPGLKSSYRKSRFHRQDDNQAETPQAGDVSGDDRDNVASARDPLNYNPQSPTSLSRSASGSIQRELYL